MESDDELFYLQPGFDLSSLTMPKLRSILVANDVQYPASSKKPQLIQIITDEILPRSRKLLSARARTKRTSRGITDMGNGEDDDDGELMPPPPAPKTPRSRKSKSNLGTDGTVEATPATTRKSRTPGARKSSTKHARASDTETDAEKPTALARKTRKSLPSPTSAETPKVKIEEPHRRIKRESLEAGESPFSDDNPFQSASSPGSESRRVSSTSRTRKSLGADGRKSMSTSRRRQPTSPPITQQEDGIRAPSRSTFEFPVAKLGSNDAELDELEPTEEFTPQAAQELEEERVANGQLVRKGPSTLTRRRKRGPTSSAVKWGPWGVLGILAAAGAGWYRQEKIAVGYCGVGQQSWSLASNPHIPKWVHETSQPTCEPCPQHAICYPNMEVKCDDDFLLTPHPMSLAGIVPLPPTCEPDSEKSRRIKIVADRAVEELRDRRAAYECGTDIDGTPVSEDEVEGVQTVVKAGEQKLEIAEESLKKEVGKMRKKGMTTEEFDDLWRGALGEIMGMDEVEVMRDGSGRVFLSSSSLARLPFTCFVRRSVRRSISRNRIPLSILTILIFGILYLRSRILTYRQATAQIPALVGTTLDRLATQAALKEDGRSSEGFISVGQLRDDVLRNVFSASERERVWKGVRAVVEGNSNVRAATREGGRTGEFSRVWEWIGPVSLAPGLEGRRSGGFVREAEDSPAADNGNTGREVIENRKWDEGRPIY